MGNLKLFKQKVLVIGANGLLGQKIVETFLDDFEVHGIGRKNKPSLEFDKFNYTVCDITNREQILELVRTFEPHFIVNSAAYTNVDGCEDEKEDCWKINVVGVENLAKAAKRFGIHVVHISTDYVFDGVEGNYDEESRPKPLGYYGRTKLAAENALISSGIDCAIVRTMVLFGMGIDLNHNFVTWIIEKLTNGESIKIVDDQFGHPTLVDDLAKAILKIVDLKKTGIYNIAGSECMSRFELAQKIAEVFDLNSALIHSIKTKDLNQKAPRPLNSSFDLNKTLKELGFQLSDVEKGLQTLRQQLDNSKLLAS
ncbi:dTDP-4-dehydrorhamnose reductase [candidate division KSB1 bacterium]|nr:dTDP-4-dehydrorhamnose reductase [candidate division KSB1 bacterium]